MKKFKLFYSIQNGGDGSAIPLFFNSPAKATADQEEHNEGGQGWAEDCSGEVILTYQDGKLFVEQYIPSREEMVALPEAENE